MAEQLSLNARMPLSSEHEGMSPEAVPVDPEGIAPEPQGMPNASMPVLTDHDGMPAQSVAVDPVAITSQPQGMPLEDAAVAGERLEEHQGRPQAMEPLAPQGMNVDVAGYEEYVGVEEAGMRTSGTSQPRRRQYGLRIVWQTPSTPRRLCLSMYTMLFPDSASRYPLPSPIACMPRTKRVAVWVSIFIGHLGVCSKSTGIRHPMGTCGIQACGPV